MQNTDSQRLHHTNSLVAGMDHRGTNRACWERNQSVWQGREGHILQSTFLLASFPGFPQACASCIASIGLRAPVGIKQPTRG